MIHQYWLSNDQWDKDDPKLKQLRTGHVELTHTKNLAEAIDLEPSGILIVRGPRQTGKSTFLRQFAQRCLAQGVKPDMLALLDAERCESWQELLSEIEPFLKQHQERTVLLIDEVTSVDRWWKAIKVAADEGLTRNSLLVCTGSSAMDQAQGADLLPGRRGRRHPVDLELLPVRYRDISSKLAFKDYLLTGGMPWAISEYLSRGFIPAFVYALYAGWIEGSLTKNRHTAGNLPSVLNYIARRVGSSFSVTSLARDCGIGSNSTAESILSILENNYILLTSRWSEPGSVSVAPRKNRKFFAFDPFLYHIFNDYDKGWEATEEMARTDLDDPEKTSRLVENVVASELRHIKGMYPLRYYLGRREVDFIGAEFIEVKYQRTVSLAEFEWVKNVVSPKSYFTVITKQTRAREGNMRLVPIEEWLLEE
jgi:hypothetical protein